MLAITIDTAHAVTVSIAVTLFATQSAPLPSSPGHSFSWSESRQARTCWSRYAQRWSWRGAAAGGRGDITSVRLAVASLLVWHDIAPLAVQHSCFSSTSVSGISLSFILSLSLPLHYDIYCHFSCHLQSKCGKWQMAK